MWAYKTNINYNNYFLRVGSFWKVPICWGMMFAPIHTVVWLAYITIMKMKPSCGCFVINFPLLKTKRNVNMHTHTYTLVYTCTYFSHSTVTDAIYIILSIGDVCFPCAYVSPTPKTLQYHFPTTESWSNPVFLPRPTSPHSGWKDQMW